jgi:hypothetical protein
MPDRRHTERRKAPKRVKRGIDRRGGDRRDSERAPMVYLIRSAGAKGPWDLRQGELSMGGIFWADPEAPPSKSVEVRFRLPGTRNEVRAFGEVLRLREGGGSPGLHVRFTYLDIESELAIARYLHQRNKGK